MTVLNLAEAGVLSEDRLVRGIALTIVTVDKWIAQLPFVTTEGKSITYVREDSAAGASFLSPDGTSDTTQAKFTRISEPLTRLEGLAEIDNFATIGQSNTNDQLAVMIAAKAKAIAREFQKQAIVGVKAADNSTFNGLRNLVGDTSTGQTIDDTGTTTGATLSLSLLDRLVLSITADDGRVDFITCHSKMIKKIRDLYRNLGGTPKSEEVEIMVPDRLNPDRKRPMNVLGFDGIPIFRNDFISVTESDGGSNGSAGAEKTRIYAGQFESRAAPSRSGLFGIMPERLEDLFVVYEPFQHQSKGQWNVRVEMYTGMGLYSDKALTCLKNIEPNL